MAGKKGFKCVKLGCAFPSSTYLQSVEINNRMMSKLSSIIGDEQMSYIKKPLEPYEELQTTNLIASAYKTVTTFGKAALTFILDPLQSAAKTTEDIADIPDKFMEIYTSGVKRFLETRSNAWFSDDVIEEWNKSCTGLGAIPLRYGSMRKDIFADNKVDYSGCPFPPESVKTKKGHEIKLKKKFDAEIEALITPKKVKKKLKKEKKLSKEAWKKLVEELTEEKALAFNDDKYICHILLTEADNLFKERRFAEYKKFVIKANVEEECRMPLKIRYPQNIEETASNKAWDELVLLFETK